MPPCPPRVRPTLVAYSVLSEPFLHLSFMVCTPICFVLYMSWFSPQILRPPCAGALVGCSSVSSPWSAAQSSEHSKGSKVFTGLN